jgi:hypothetical protein
MQHQRSDSHQDKVERAEHTLQSIPIPTENDDALQRLLGRLDEAESRARNSKEPRDEA